MKSHRVTITLHEPERMGFVNITPDVEEAVDDSGVQEGLCLVNAMHITASVFINDDESGLHVDFERQVEEPGPAPHFAQHLRKCLIAWADRNDYNIYADAPGIPTLRHSWNPDNTLQQWQQRFNEDQHSKLLPVRFEFRGMAFKLLSREGMDAAGPLPEQCGWKPPAPERVGASTMQWP